MALRQKIRIHVFMCAGLLVLPAGRAALSCCRTDLSGGSTSCHLSHAPDPACNTQWTADGVVVVEEFGKMDQNQVRHAGPQDLVLKGKHRDVIFRMDCVDLQEGGVCRCEAPCGSPEELTSAPASARLHSTHAAEWQRSDGPESRRTTDGLFLLSIIISLIFITALR